MAQNQLRYQGSMRTPPPAGLDLSEPFPSSPISLRLHERGQAKRALSKSTTISFQHACCPTRMSYSTMVFVRHELHLRRCLQQSRQFQARSPQRGKARSISISIEAIPPALGTSPFLRPDSGSELLSLSPRPRTSDGLVLASRTFLNRSRSRLQNFGWKPL